jgi:alkylhydroperoxidase family enzyme
MSSVPRTPLTLADAAPGLGHAWSAFQRVAYPGKVDIVTRELVRIASGRLSRCSICRNTRVRAAIDRGLDEEMVAGLDDLDASRLSERHKAAVRFAEAFLVDPASFSPADREALARHFTADQIAELVLDLVRYRPGSKMTVAAGQEPADDALVVI